MVLVLKIFIRVMPYLSKATMSRHVNDTVVFWRQRMDKAELKVYLAAGEGLTSEFKRCGADPQHDLYETVCSFANRQGGNIFLGIGDDGSVIGISPARVRDVQRMVVNAVSNPKLFSIPPVIETEAIEVDGAWVVRIWVPAGPGVYSFKGTMYDRIADADVKVSGVEQITMLYLRKQNEYSERRVFKYVTLEDFDPSAIQHARSLAVARTPDHPWGAMSDEELLRSAKLYRKDRRTGEQGYTLASVLLFGRDECIADVCPSYKTDAIARIEDEDRYDDRLTFTGNLIDAYEGLVLFAKQHIQDRFSLIDGQRVSVRDVVIREVVANLLIHREYISPFPAKLVISRAQLVTENASRAMFEGRLTLSDFNPVSKNPSIAGVFREIGYAEELGSGFRNIQKCSLAYSGKAASLEDGDVFKAIVPLTPIAVARGGEGVYGVARMLCERDGFLTSLTLSEYLGVTARTAQRHIRHLLDEGMIDRDKNNSRRYVAK